MMSNQNRLITKTRLIIDIGEYTQAYVQSAAHQFGDDLIYRLELWEQTFRYFDSFLRSTRNC